MGVRTSGNKTTIESYDSVMTTVSVSVSADGHFRIPEGTTTIDSREGDCLWEKWGLDQDKEAVKTVTIPESVTTIGEYALSETVENENLQKKQQIFRVRGKRAQSIYYS